MNFSKPGDLLKASRDKRMKRAVMSHLKRKGFKVGEVKHSGSFHGKSNALGQGGRAAQLKARGVPGGVIGMMARKVGAAPGQKNFHKKAKSKKHEKKHKKVEKEEKKKGSSLNGSEMMAMKEAKRKEASKKDASGVHIHIHLEGSKVSGMGFGDEGEQGLGLEHAEEGAKHFKKAKKTSGKSFGDESIQGAKEEREGEKAEHFKKSKKEKKSKSKRSKKV